MIGSVEEVAGVRAYVLAEEGPLLACERDAVNLVGESLSAGASFVVVPVSRLSAEFLDLKTGLAGEALQKLVGYRRRVAILGDIGEAVARSAALRDFVRESNRGRHVWFVADRTELERRLAAE